MTSPAPTDDLIVAHLHLVHPIARRLKKALPDHIEQDEIESLLTLGLVQAARRWDTDRAAQAGASFITYARHRMVGAVLDALRAYDMLPRRERQRVRAGLTTHFVEQWSPVHHDEHDDGLRAARLQLEACASELRAGLDDVVARARAILAPTLFVLWWAHQGEGVQVLALSRRHGWTPDVTARLLEQAHQQLEAAGVYATQSVLAPTAPGREDA